MSGRWWRAYSRARHDPKLLKLSDKHFRWWFSFVCAASDNDGTLPLCADLAVEFRTSEKIISALLDALIAADLLEHDETGIHPHNWNGLQYKSDTSADRMRRHRERHRDDQSDVTSAVTVTRSESDTESEQNRTDSASRSGTRLPDDWSPSPEDRTFAEQHGKNPDFVAQVFRDYWRGVAGARGRKADWAATWRNWVRRDAPQAEPKILKFN